jgi:hypothetical protein
MNAPETSSSPLRQRDIIRMLLERGSSEHSSVTLARNSKGDTTIEVIVRTSDGGEAQSLAEAEALAQAVYDRLRSAYPFGSAPANGGESS